jgi:hypothetical protein
MCSLDLSSKLRCYAEYLPDHPNLKADLLTLICLTYLAKKHLHLTLLLTFISLSSLLLKNIQNADPASSNDDEMLTSQNRLRIFRKLQQGNELSTDRCLPHIRSSSYTTNSIDKQESKDDRSSVSATVHQKEQCWKVILLPNDSDIDKWSLVREHFSNSQSNKVLSIIQQK